MGTGVFMQHDDTRPEHTGTLSLHGDTQHALFHEFHWLTTLGTKELNDRSLALFGRILHMERRHFTASHRPRIL
jgi:hypothetical protein